MNYKIDGTDVNSRTDWRQTFRPVPPSRTEEGFPGVAGRYVIRAPKDPDDIQIDGFLEGTGDDVEEAATALITAARGWSAILGGVATHTVEVHDVTFASMELIEFGMTGPLTAASPAGSGGAARVRQACRFVWRQLIAGGDE